MGAPPSNEHHNAFNALRIGAASAVIMLMTIAAIMIPYLYAELKEKRE